MTELNTFSLTSNKLPELSEPLPVGQLNFPPRSDFEEAFEDIFQRRFFTNHGPLVGKLDKEVAAFLEVKHAICVTNGTVALMVACASLGLTGTVIVPSFTFPATVQSLEWAGLKPIFCDIDPLTHNLNPHEIPKLIQEDTSAILGVHVWGRPCDTDKLQGIADEHDLEILYDACHAFGSSHHGKKLGNFGALEVFSFHATKILNAAEGGCIVTNDDSLAARLRTTRNFHSSHSEASCPLRINGKMTEAQAAMGLLSLKDYQNNVIHNCHIWNTYFEALNLLPGVRIITFNSDEAQNYQYFVLQIDETKFGLSRDQLLEILRAENILARRYFFPAVHQLQPYNTMYPDTILPETEQLTNEILQLPLGGRVTPLDAHKICQVINNAHKHAPTLANFFQSQLLQPA